MTTLFFKPSSKRSEHGQATPVFVILLVIILMLAGFAVDMAVFYLAHQKLKKAADAGALAGAILLRKGGYDEDFIRARVQSLAGLNFTNGALWKNSSFTVTINPAGPVYEVGVAAQAEVTTLFFKLIALKTMTVQTVAKATSYASETQSAKLLI